MSPDQAHDGNPPAVDAPQSPSAPSGSPHQGRLRREARFHDHLFVRGPRSTAGFYTVAAQATSHHHEALEKRASAGVRTLELGCGTGRLTSRLANKGADAIGIDLSIEGIRQATTSHGSSRASFMVMNAEALGFPGEHFDLVYGTGILHHLDLQAVCREMTRVLKPDGRAMFLEPLGHNAIINLFRRATPELRTQDERPLLTKDLRFLAEHFHTDRISTYGLCVLGALPFRGTRLFAIIRRVLEWMDAILLRMPWLKWQAWIVVLQLEQPCHGSSTTT